MAAADAREGGNGVSVAVTVTDEGQGLYLVCYTIKYCYFAGFLFNRPHCYSFYKTLLFQKL